MWYEEMVSNFEIAVAKLKETLQNVKFATLCPERSIGTSLWPPKIKKLDQKTIPFTIISHLL
jgi:precorrin-6B methylase 1